MRRVLLIFAFCAVSFLSYSIGRNTERTELVTVKNSIITSVAHIHLEDKKNYRLLFKDSKNDVAYYISNNSNLVSVGDSVTVMSTGVDYVVSATDATGFYFKADDSIHAGLSGVAVVNCNGNQVGYISELTQKGYVHCIWTI